MSEHLGTRLPKNLLYKGYVGTTVKWLTITSEAFVSHLCYNSTTSRC